MCQKVCLFGACDSLLRLRQILSRFRSQQEAQFPFEASGVSFGDN